MYIRPSHAAGYTLPWSWPSTPVVHTGRRGDLLRVARATARLEIQEGVVLLASVIALDVQESCHPSEAFRIIAS